MKNLFFSNKSLHCIFSNLGQLSTLVALSLSLNFLLYSFIFLSLQAKIETSRNLNNWGYDKILKVDLNAFLDNFLKSTLDHFFLEFEY